MTMESREPQTRTPRNIPVRRPTFAFERVTEKHWMSGDPFMTHMLHALSLTFPEGERFFMDAVRHFSGDIDSPVLRHEVSRFLAQEGMHGRAHVAFNEWIRDLGNDTASIENEVRENLAEARREAKPIEQLGVTCALEHFTAMLAEVLLETDWLRDQIHPDVQGLWVWHAIEETEHKAVAFDVFQAAGGTYATRAVTMLITTYNFLNFITDFQGRLMKADPALSGSSLRRAKLRGWYKLLVSPGPLRSILPAYLDYFRPRFHPWQRQSKRGFAHFRDTIDAYAASASSVCAPKAIA